MCSWETLVILQGKPGLSGIDGAAGAAGAKVSLSVLMTFNTDSDRYC